MASCSLTLEHRPIEEQHWNFSTLVTKGIGNRNEPEDLVKVDVPVLGLDLHLITNVVSPPRRIIQDYSNLRLPLRVLTEAQFLVSCVLKSLEVLHVRH